MDAQTHAQTRTALPKSLQSTSSTSCLLMCAPLQSHLVANPTIDALKHALKHARHSQKQYSPQAAQAACSCVPPYILTSSPIPPQTRSNTRSNTRGTPKNITVHKQHKLPAHMCPLSFSPRHESHHRRTQTRAALPQTLQPTSSTRYLFTCAPLHSYLVANSTTDALKHARHSHKHCGPQGSYIIHQLLHIALPVADGAPHVQHVLLNHPVDECINFVCVCACMCACAHLCVILLNHPMN